MCVHLWFKMEMVCNGGPNRIKTGVGVDCPPPHQYLLFYLFSLCVAEKEMRWAWQTAIPQKSVMDSIGGKYFQFSKEMKISLAVNASVNWLKKLEQHRGLRECYQYFSRNPPSDERCVVSRG